VWLIWSRPRQELLVHETYRVASVSSVLVHSSSLIVYQYFPPEFGPCAEIVAK
jgi:hypothetical protein